jgi:hypothetical protein
MSTVTSTEDLVHALRIGNAGKMASLGSIAHATRLRAAIGRMDDYIEAFQHAHETANLSECQGLGIAMQSAAGTIADAARCLDDAVARELAASRAAA